MNLTCKEDKGIMKVDVMKEGQMFTINGEELTPLEVTQLAYYYALNWDWDVSTPKNSEGM